MKKRYVDLTIGIFFLALGLISTTVFYAYDQLTSLLWFCNNTSFVLGLAFLLRSKFLITAETVLGFVPQVIWTVDYLGNLFGVNIFNATTYMFDPSYPTMLYVLSLHHLLLLPAMLYGIRSIGFHKLGWIGALGHGALLWAVSFFLTNPELNLNCIHQSCVSILPTTMYSFIWPLFYSVAALLPTYLMMSKVNA